MTLFDAFERIVVINLPERTDRRRETLAELRRARVDRDDPRLEIFAGIRPADAAAFPSVGARGCFESHLGVIEAAIRDRVENVLILEDDLALEPAACVPQPALARRIAAGGWDFAYPGHVLPRDSATVHTGWEVTSRPLVCAHFYALHRRILPDLRDYLHACAQRPPGHPDGGPMHVDGAYSMFRTRRPDVVTLIATPSLGGQRSSRSDIAPCRWYDRHSALRTLVGTARKGKNLWRAAGRSAAVIRP